MTRPTSAPLFPAQNVGILIVVAAIALFFAAGSFSPNAFSIGGAVQPASIQDSGSAKVGNADIASATNCFLEMNQNGYTSMNCYVPDGTPGEKTAYACGVPFQSVISTTSTGSACNATGSCETAANTVFFYATQFCVDTGC